MADCHRHILTENISCSPVASPRAPELPADAAHFRQALALKLYSKNQRHNHAILTQPNAGQGMSIQKGKKL
jgi:hypothetical protein